MGNVDWIKLENLLLHKSLYFLKPQRDLEKKSTSRWMNTKTHPLR